MNIEGLYNGRKIRTYTGRFVDVFNLKPEDIDIVDIAHSLAHQCRFAGHIHRFYSVAEHSIMVAQNLPKPHKLTGLLHDASEAYFIDMPKPIKEAIPELVEIENNIQKVIAQKYDLHFPWTKEVHDVDKFMLEYEWSNRVIADKLLSMNTHFAKFEFLRLFNTLTNGK
jgi:hypothetical protein